MVLIVSAGVSLWRHGHDRTTLATWLSALPADGAGEADRELSSTPRLARDPRPQVR